MPNTVLFANALNRLHEGGLLKNPACKDPALMFIRRSTETKHHHLTAHYRTRSAGQILEAQSFRSGNEYQKYCNSHLRHEHVVPGKVIYEMILQQEEIAEPWLLDTLQRFGIRATITREENARLEGAGLATRMPNGFFDPASPLYQNPLSRYIAIGLDTELVPRHGEAWPLSAAPADLRRAPPAAVATGNFRARAPAQLPNEIPPAFKDAVAILIQGIELPAGFRWSYRADGITTLHYGANNVVLELRPSPAQGMVGVRSRPIARRDLGELYPDLADAAQMPPNALEAFVSQLLAPFRGEGLAR